VVSRQPLLDLSRFTTPEQLSAIRRIERVALVVVPDSLAAAYAAIPAHRVAATVFVPDGARVRVHTGALEVSGDGLGAPEDVLVVVGVLLVRSPVTGPLPRQVSVIGSVFAPRGSEGALGAVLGGGVGGVTYYRYAEGQDVRLFTGQVRLSGATLANPDGGADDLLIAAGQVIVTGPVSTVGYAEVYVTGQLVAPAASRDVLAARLRVQGQAAWYRGGEPWVVYEDTTIGPDFLRLLPGPVSLVVLGDLTIADGVTEAALREKVTDVALLGDVVAPADLVPLIQVLAPDALGTIRAADAGGPGR
jgi:hypothetical protein